MDTVSEEKLSMNRKARRIKNCLENHKDSEDKKFKQILHKQKQKKEIEERVKRDQWCAHTAALKKKELLSNSKS